MEASMNEEIMHVNRWLAYINILTTEVFHRRISKHTDMILKKR